MVVIEEFVTVKDYPYEGKVPVRMLEHAKVLKTKSNKKEII